MRAVGENLAASIRGETTILEHMTKDGILDKYYENALGFETGNKLIKGLVKQLGHRYPHMSILEIGAGTGGATAGILEELGTAFASYTYTDISASFFQKAAEKFKTYTNRMLFKTLNVEKDPTTQGFVEHSYDLVIASNVLHATRCLEETLRNTRQLLKPGGYLMLLEIVPTDPNGTGPMREGVVMGGLPGWWVGRDEGRKWAPTIPLKQWNALLKKTGFAGIDTATPLVDPLPFITSAFAAQAIDEGMTLYRRPLRAKSDEIMMPTLILLGGNSLETSRMIDDLESILSPFSDNVITAATLEDLADIEIPPMCTVLSLADLDSAVLKGVTEERWEILKRVFSTARNVLWVTRNYRCEDAYAGMIVGLCRSITYELSQLRLQMLDIDQSRLANATTIAEIFLRLQLTTQWEESGSRSGSLWTMEPEMVIEDEHLKILRVTPAKPINDRYNSAKRLITEDLNLALNTVSLECHDNSYVIREKPGTVSVVGGHSIISVEHSLLSSLRTKLGRFFVCLGVEKATGTKVLCLSETNASTISVPEAWIVPITLPNGDPSQYLSHIAEYCLAQEILRTMPSGGTLLVHAPFPALPALLSAQAGKSISRIVYTTSVENSKEANTLYIHPRTPKRTIDAAVPADLAAFLDLSTSVSNDNLAVRIQASIPVHCERSNLSTLIANESVTLAADQDNVVSNLLKNAASFALDSTNSKADSIQPEAVTLQDVMALTVSLRPFTVVDWRQGAKIPAVVEPIDTRRDIFSSTKTFWLVGLSGDLGRSLCDWMIQHGARYIALTSRSTKVPEEWIKEHADKGVTVTWFPVSNQIL